MLPAKRPLPATTIDPESVVAVTLSVDEPGLIWEYALAEDPMPSVAAVAVEPVRLTPLAEPAGNLDPVAGGDLTQLIGTAAEQAQAAGGADAGASGSSQAPASSRVLGQRPWGPGRD